MSDVPEATAAQRKVTTAPYCWKVEVGMGHKPIKEKEARPTQSIL